MTKAGYQAYLASDKWKRIRAAVMLRDKGRCRSCGRPASQVHHGDYSRATIKGSDLRMLFAICGRCHLDATFGPTGKRTPQEVKRWALDLLAATAKLKGRKRRKKKPRGRYVRLAASVKVSTPIETLRALSERYAYGDPVPASASLQD